MSADDLKPRPLLSGRAVCAALGISHATLKAWVADGRFPAVNLGGRIRYSEKAIAAFEQRLGTNAADATKRGAA